MGGEPAFHLLRDRAPSVSFWDEDSKGRRWLLAGSGQLREPRALCAPWRQPSLHGPWSQRGGQPAGSHRSGALSLTVRSTAPGKQEAQRDWLTATEGGSCRGRQGSSSGTWAPSRPIIWLDTASRCATATARTSPHSSPEHTATRTHRDSGWNPVPTAQGSAAYTAAEGTRGQAPAQTGKHARAIQPSFQTVPGQVASMPLHPLHPRGDEHPEPVPGSELFSLL